MNCRLGCGACCIAPSITSPLPNMPDGKPSGVRCVNLNEDNLCDLFGQDKRPALCDQFKAEYDVCGDNAEQAFSNIIKLEQLTS